MSKKLRVRNFNTINVCGVEDLRKVNVLKYNFQQKKNYSYIIYNNKYFL